MNAPLLGRLGRPWCPYCRAPVGPDCPGKRRTHGQVRATERRVWLRVTDEDDEERT